MSTLRFFPRWRISIRVKLLLVTASLLVIPWVGTGYVQEMETFLRGETEQALLNQANIVASILANQQRLFTQQKHIQTTHRPQSHLFVRPLHSPIQLDGYLNDWEEYEERMQNFTAKQAVKGSENTSLSFQYQVGSYKKYLYAVFKIKDDRIVYRQPNSLSLEKSDHLIIALQDPQGELQRYIITTIAPGWVNAHRISNDLIDPQPLGPEVRIKGEWQESRDGYNIEIRIPKYLIGNRLSFAVADIDSNDERITDTIIATASIYDANELGTIVFPNTEIERLLKKIQKPSTRIWIIDRYHRVIARTGRLQQDNDDAEQSFFAGLMKLFYRTVLKTPTNQFYDEFSNASTLDSEEFTLALKGKPQTRWRNTSNNDVNILTATAPIEFDDNVIGAVAIEQTSNDILLQQNRALEIMFNLSALAFLIATVVLLSFATRLSLRIRHLRDSAENAITQDGRVVGEISTLHARDEIGDLSRSVADMLQRLAQYNRYLESMASKLSHELRTPITVVRSSLDNLDENELDANTLTYTQRAREGVQRLNNILTRMSEATRLEQTLQSEQQLDFDIEKVINGCVEGYKLAHQHCSFEFNCNKLYDSQPLAIHGVPDLIAQMLDKLISNAIDFHTADTAIEVKLSADETYLQLVVQNQGATLPEQMQDNLFDSMVSVREKRGDQPHLGLGLYIVRMIVEFHKGSVKARNRDDVAGVMFVIRFPLTK